MWTGERNELFNNNGCSLLCDKAFVRPTDCGSQNLVNTSHPLQTTTWLVYPWIIRYTTGRNPGIIRYMTGIIRYMTGYTEWQLTGVEFPMTEGLFVGGTRHPAHCICWRWGWGSRGMAALETAGWAGGDPGSPSSCPRVLESTVETSSAPGQDCGRDSECGHCGEFVCLAPGFSVQGEFRGLGSA